jgi:hypothetical protein
MVGKIILPHQAIVRRESLSFSPACNSAVIRLTITSVGDAIKIYSEGLGPGSVVLVTLNNPREKFWGMVLSLTQAGACLRGVDLRSLDDFSRLVKSGEAASPEVVFFPMHRVERIELDARNGEIPSLAEQFGAKSGIEAGKFFQGSGR